MAENLAQACSHSRDFRSVVWFGTEYRFNPQQAACVQVLWRAWLGGTPIIREELVLDTAHIEARSLKDVFRTPPGRNAWGAMIGNGDRRGTVRLQEIVEDPGREDYPAADAKPEADVSGPPAS